MTVTFAHKDKGTAAEPRRTAAPALRAKLRPLRRRSRAADRPFTFGNVATNLALDGLVQAKSLVSHPHDPLEQEADRVADRVMRMTEPPSRRDEVLPSTTEPLVQRSCQSCNDDEELIQPKRSDSGTTSPITSGTNMPSVVNALRPRGQGRPLSNSERSVFEPRFGRDFGAVRIHTDAQSDHLARLLSARSYTIGHDIAFASGQYNPGTYGGRKLLAHELTHVVQQTETNREPHPISSFPYVQRKFYALEYRNDFADLVNSIFDQPSPEPGGSMQNIKEITLNPTTGEVSLNESSRMGWPSREALVLESVLRRMINEGETRIAFSRAITNTWYGGFDTELIDLQDIETIDDLVGVPWSRAAVLIHELSEQFVRQSYGITDYDTAHDSTAVPLESRAIGAETRLPEIVFRGISNPVAENLRPRTIRIHPHRYAGNRIIDVILHRLSGEPQPLILLRSRGEPQPLVRERRRSYVVRVERPYSIDIQVQRYDLAQGLLTWTTLHVENGVVSEVQDES